MANLTGIATGKSSVPRALPTLASGEIALADKLKLSGCSFAEDVDAPSILKALTITLLPNNESLAISVMAS